MLTAKFTNISEWRSTLIAISEMSDDAILICTNNGIKFRVMDHSHVALLEVHFPKSSFLELDCQNSLFSVNVVDFMNIMTAVGDDDLVQLTIKGKKLMQIKVEGSLKMEYNLRLIKRSEINIPMPRVEVKSKISLTPNTLEKILGNIERVSEYLMINSLEGGIEFSGKGNAGDAKINLEKGSVHLPLHDFMEESISAYEIVFMTKILKSIGKICRVINMEYGNQTPVKMHFEMPSMANAEYYLAPKIEF